MKYPNLDKVLKAWNDLQPLSERDKMRLSRRFTVDFNFNSNHIEGNTLTYGQTELLLLFGKVIGTAEMRDLEEMKALSTANIHRSRPEELRQEVSLANTQWNLLGAEDKKAKTAVFKQSFIDRNSNNPRYLNDPEHFIKNNFRPRLEYIRQVTGLEIANDTIKNALSDCLERSSEKPVTSTAAEEGVEEALSSEAGDGKEKKKSEKKPMSANKILKALKKIEHDLEDYSNVTGNDNVLVTIGKTTDAVADLIDTIMACEDTAV